MPPKAVIKVSKKVTKVIKKQKTVDSVEPHEPSILTPKQVTPISEPSTHPPEPTIENYMNSLTEEEKKTMEIAKSHLGTSFNIKRSIGYINWVAKQT